MLGSISRMKSLIAPPLSSVSKASHFSPFFPLPSTSKISLLPAFRRNPIAPPLKTPVMLSVFPFQNRGLQSKAFPSSSSGEIHVIIGPMFAGKTTTLLRRMQSESEDGSLARENLAFLAKLVKLDYHWLEDIASFQVSNFLQLDKMLRSLCFSGKMREAVGMLWRMRSKVDHRTYALLLQECMFWKQYKLGRRIHAQMVAVGYVPNEYLKTKLLILYAKSGDLKSAHVLFDMLIDKSLISWNAMIAGYVQNKLEEIGIGLYYKMRQNGLIPDQYTFASLFRACAALAMVEHGKKAHATLMKCHLRENVVIRSALIDMYFKCSYLSDGRKVFDSALEKNVITWTSLISGYGQHGRVAEVLESFSRMKDKGFRPNYVTFLAVLSACSHGGLINEGWDYFRSMQRDFGIRPRGQHYAAMVDMLGRAGRLQEAYEFVLSAPCKDHSVIWGALLGACRIHGNMDLVKIVAKKYLELDSVNAGKYVVLSNTYASFGCWDNVANVRSMMKDSGIMKEAAYSRIDVQGEVHHFLTGGNTHEKFEEICQTINRIMWVLREAGYVIDMEEH